MVSFKTQKPNVFYLVPFKSLLLNLEESRRQIIMRFIKQTKPAIKFHC